MRRQLSKSSSSSSFFFSFFFLRSLFLLLFSSVPIKLVRLKQGTLTRPPPRASKQQRACAPVRRSRSAARATPRRAEGGVTLGRTKARLFLSQRRRSHFFDVVESLAFLFQSHSLSLISTESLTLLSPPPFSQYISLLPSSLLFFTPFRIPKRKEEQKTSTNIHILRGLFHSLLL